MGVRGPPAGVRVDQARTQDKRLASVGWAVGRVDTWYSLSMHGYPTMRVALASSRLPADTPRFLGARSFTHAVHTRRSILVSSTQLTHIHPAVGTSAPRHVIAPFM